MKKILFYIGIVLVLGSSCGWETTPEEPLRDSLEQKNPPENRRGIKNQPVLPLSLPHDRETSHNDLFFTPSPAVNRTLTDDIKKKHWHLFGKKGINIEKAWDITNGSKDLSIAVIDSNFLPNQQVFTQGQCNFPAITYRNFLKTPSSSPKKDHGARVSSFVQTCIDNPLDLLGINAYSSVAWLEAGSTSSGVTNDLLLWAMGNKDICQTSSFLACNEANLKPAHIINLSWGTVGISTYNKKIFLDIIRTANDRRTILVAASGNESCSADKIFPAGAPGVISVGATDKKGNAAGFSNWGETVEIMAPGQFLPTVNDDNGQVLGNGTSFSAPIVSSVLSLVRSVYPQLDWKTAIYLLQSNAVSMDCNAYCSDNYNNYKTKNPNAQAQCKQDCCIGATQICTPGRLDAGATVAAAQKLNGKPPQVPLIDAHTYAINLFRDATKKVRQGAVILFNLGGARGDYVISSPNNQLQFNKTSITLEPRGSSGDRVIITVTADESFSSEAQIVVKSTTSGHIADFSDKIVLYAFPR